MRARHTRMIVGKRSACAFTALLIATLVRPSLGSAVEAGDAGAPFARAVRTVKVGRVCFDETVQATGTVAPRHEVQVRSDREGWRISEILVENGDIVVSGQVLARLHQLDSPSGTKSAAVQAPAGGRIYSSSAFVGGIVTSGGEPLFRIAQRGDMELVGEIPVNLMSHLSLDLPASVEIVGIGEISGKMRAISTSVNRQTQLAQVFISLESHPQVRVGVFGQATIRVANRCGPSLPLSAVLYGAGDRPIVQVVRNDRVETRRVKVGLVRGGKAEIQEGVSEGEIAVMRAGAFLRDGDRVAPVATTSLSSPQ